MNSCGKCNKLFPLFHFARSLGRFAVSPLFFFFSFFVPVRGGFIMGRYLSVRGNVGSSRDLL